MSDTIKLSILVLIRASAEPGKPARFSFNSFSKSLDLAKEKLDELLKELNKDRFISQYAKKGVDSFMLTLNQKGFDAVQDESFI